jgi:hypothetical protein
MSAHGRDARELGAKVNEKAWEMGAAPHSGTDQSPAEKLKCGAVELTGKREKQERSFPASQSAKVKYNLSAALSLSAVSKKNRRRIERQYGYASRERGE